MKLGDRVRLIGIPPDVRDDREFRTRALFEKCLGKVFLVAGFENVEGLSFQLVRLDVGEVVGKATIWKQYRSSPCI